jgi:hypothetical protein
MQPTICPPLDSGGCSRLTFVNGIRPNLLVYGQGVYYSTLTFTTLGFGDFRPLGIGQALTTVETALGTILIALLVFMLGRRAAR